MFLVDNKLNEANYDINLECFNILDESLNALNSFNENCLKMIKLEHHALVENDNDLLIEGENNFKEKVKKIADNLLARFIQFINRVKEQWSKFWSNTLSKTVNLTKTNINADNYITDGNKNKILIDGDIHGCSDLIKFYLDLKKMNTNQESIQEKLKELSEFDTSNKNPKISTYINNDTVRIATGYLELRPKMIETLEDFRRKAKECYKNDLEHNSENSLSLAKFSTLISKCISVCNKYTGFAVKVCNACNKLSSKTDEYKSDKKNKVQRDEDDYYKAYTGKDGKTHKRYKAFKDN